MCSPTMKCSFVLPGPPNLSTPTQCSFANFSPRSTVAPGPTAHDITQRGGRAAAVRAAAAAATAASQPPSGKNVRSVVSMPGPSLDAEEAPVGRTSFFGRLMAMLSLSMNALCCAGLWVLVRLPAACW